MTPLAKLWEKNVRKKEPNTEKGDRPKALRGTDFYKELLRCYALTGDKRFLDAADALLEHGILDAFLNFSRWEHPLLKRLKRNVALKRLNWINEKVVAGVPLSRACAEVAATVGHRANSFSAATKDLENLYRREAPNLEPPEDEETLRLYVAECKKENAARVQISNEFVEGWTAKLEGRMRKEIHKNSAVEIRKILRLVQKQPVNERKKAYREIAPEMRELRKVLGTAELRKILGKTPANNSGI
jgi:hypothetical protein